MTFSKAGSLVMMNTNLEQYYGSCEGTSDFGLQTLRDQ